MIYGYLRISTCKQDLENQKFEIREFINKNSLEIDRWVEETVSSSKDLEKRKLSKLLNKLNDTDILLCSELSRLGRNLLQVMAILHQCMEKGCQVWTIKEGYKLGDDINSKVLAFAFSLSSEIEKNMIKSRTMQCLQRLKAEGKVLGRPKGSKNKKGSKLAGKAPQIKKLLDGGASKSHIARLLKVNESTLYRYLNNLPV